jgi:hypothetical protein
VETKGFDEITKGSVGEAILFSNYQQLEHRIEIK